MKEVGEMKVECNIALYAKDKKSQWYVDSGCSKHMTRDPNKFISIEKKQKGKVTFGGDVFAKIIGKGTVTLGNNRTKAKGVLLVEDIKPNILSLSQTRDQGNICIFDFDKCEIQKKDTRKLVGTAARISNNVYTLDTLKKERCCLSQINESWLWYIRMGLINFDNFIKVSNMGAIRNLPKIIKPPNSVCRHCQHGKQTKARFKIKEHTTSKPLEIVHTNLCGPSMTKSLQGEYYFMLLIDYYTRMTWLTFLKEKSEAFVKFKGFKALVENETNIKIKCLMSDNGGEFTSNQFNEFCETHGVKGSFHPQRLLNKVE